MSDKIGCRLIVFQLEGGIDNCNSKVFGRYWQKVNINILIINMSVGLTSLHVDAFMTPADDFRGTCADWRKKNGRKPGFILTDSRDPSGTKASL